MFDPFNVSPPVQAIASILSAIRALMAPPEPVKKRRIGFIQSDD